MIIFVFTLLGATLGFMVGLIAASAVAKETKSSDVPKPQLAERSGCKLIEELFSWESQDRARELLRLRLQDIERER